MKLNELITSFTISVTNEENTVLEKIDTPVELNNFSDREQFVIENLIRKSLLTKIFYNGKTLVIKNE